MVVGARLGIAILVDGSTRHMIQRSWASLRSRNRPQD
jgi:hypothetical protein